MFAEYGIPATYTETLQELLYNILVFDREIYTEEEFFNLSIEEQISAAREYIFDNYPIFDEAYRSTLETKILRHFYAREIGQEQENAFLYYLNMTLYEIMPYYNKLYETETLSFNPLYTIDRTTTHAGRNETTGKETSAEAGKRGETGSTDTTRATATAEKAKSQGGFSDTPQGAISGVMSALSDAGSGYLTNATAGNTEGQTPTAEKTGQQENRRADDVRTRAADRKQGGVDNYIDIVKGYEGKPAELIKEYRKTLLNIDLEIIKKLDDCFMQIY